MIGRNIHGVTSQPFSGLHLGKSTPVWQLSEELRLKAKKYFCCLNSDRRTIHTKPASETGNICTLSTFSGRLASSLDVPFNWTQSACLLALSPCPLPLPPLTPCPCLVCHMTGYPGTSHHLDHLHNHIAQNCIFLTFCRFVWS